MEPAKNDQLLAQMSQISQLQSSTNLTDSLKSMVQQNNLSAAGSMIGKMVKGKDLAGAEVNGVVSSVKVEDGELFLELDNGKKLGLENVTNIASASEVGQTPVPATPAAAA
jgi:flagellar hook assembly protein FlgD